MNLIADHLWQSTLFAGVVWLLTLALRKNRARVRHGLWLAASIKFLVPFSLFIALGSLVPRRAVPVAVQSKVYVVMDQVSQPFTAPAVAVTASAAPNPLPALLLSLWACGFIGITFAWCVRWRRIQVAVRAGTPVNLDIRIKAMSSPTLLEPGVFGIFQPVLLLPEGITERLAPAQLRAVIAHELCHVRYRDNLIATIHMFVETVFWFHPLVWWIGKRMVEERERACDEEVLRDLAEPKAYAEGILSVCKLYVESPLTCVSGITGADLKKRIEAIMTNRVALGLDLGRKAGLAVAALAALAMPVVVGMMHAQSPAAPKFEVASIKPVGSNSEQFRVGTFPGGVFAANNASMMILIMFAHNVRSQQILGGPGWLDSDKYDIEAKPDSATPVAPGPAGASQLRSMIQSLLAERFKLTMHRETREQPVYDLVVAKGGPKIKDAVDTAKGPIQGIRMGRGQVTGGAVQIPFLAQILSQLLGQSVIDKTGLAGKYDFELKWTPAPSEFRLPDDPGTPESVPDPLGPSIFTAVQEQLGLRLESTKGPVEVLVIDHVEKPTTN